MKFLKITLCLVLFMALTEKPSHQCKVEYLSDYKVTSFDDKKVSDFLLSKDEGIEKLWVCTLKCRDNLQCRSYQYNNLTKTCTIFEAGFDQPEETLHVTLETGARLYLMFGRLHSFGMQCSSTEDCGYENSRCPQEGSCQCAVGYNYQASTGNCVSRCDEYGNSFGAYLDHGIVGCNVISLSAPSATACMDACRDENTFLCINAEYNPTSFGCFLCDVAWWDLTEGQRVINDYGWNIYQRHCAE